MSNSSNNKPHRNLGMVKQELEEQKEHKERKELKLGKIFDDFPTVDCNECARYYDNSCDGVSKGQKRQCNSFLATRSIILPQEIKRLKRAILAVIGVSCVLCGLWIGTLVFLLTTR